MTVNKIRILVDGVEHSVLDFKAAVTGLSAGAHTITVEAYNGATLVSSKTRNFTVAEQNAAPSGVVNNYTVNEDTVLTVNTAQGVLANDTDPNGDTLTASLVSTTTNGVLVLNANGSFTYTPNANYFGSDSFVYRAFDGLLYSGNTTVAITVNDVAEPNQAPVAVADNYTLDQDTTLTRTSGQGVLANDSDPDGDSLTASLVSTTSNGVLSLNANGSFTYTPTSGYFGSDSFVYRAYDGKAYSSNRTVTFTINEVAAGYEAETIAFMTDADVNIPNDSTVFHSGTAEQITGAEYWTAIDNFIKREKTGGRWSKMITIRPRVKGIALAHAVNLKDPSTFRGTHYGSWVHNGKGSISNGANTYLATGVNLTTVASQNNVGLTATHVKDYTNTENYPAVIGVYAGASGRTSIYAQNGNATVGSTGDKLIPCGHKFEASGNFNYENGVVSMNVLTGSTKTFANGVIKLTQTTADTLPDGLVTEGAMWWVLNTEARNISKGIIGTTAVHAGLTDSEAIGFTNSINTLEADLKRKTW